MLSDVLRREQQFRLLLLALKLSLNKEEKRKERKILSRFDYFNYFFNALSAVFYNGTPETSPAGIRYNAP